MIKVLNVSFNDNAYIGLLLEKNDRNCVVKTSV